MVNVYSKDPQIKPLEEVTFMQKMRKIVLAQDIEASVPYLFHILRQLTELMDALFKYYGQTDLHSDSELDSN